MKCSQELMLGRTQKGGAKRICVDNQRIDWKDSVPRREQASMVSLKFYDTLAEPYALLLWAASGGGGCTSASDPSGELGSFCLENETYCDCRSCTCPRFPHNIFLHVESIRVDFFPPILCPPREEKYTNFYYSEMHGRKKNLFKKMADNWREGKKERRKCSFLDLKSICLIKPKSN